MFALPYNEIKTLQLWYMTHVMSARGLRVVTFLAGSVHRVLTATVDSHEAQADARSNVSAEQQAATKALVLHSVRLLGLAPADLFENLVQGVEPRIRAEYEEEMANAQKEASLAQASPAEHLPLQLHTLP